MTDFVSAPPQVTLMAAFERPYEHAIAAARTCYSAKGIMSADEVSGIGLDPERQAQRAALRDRIADSTWKAGHHTTLQHGHLQFGLDRVSRQFVWNFLHAHPFYNSEQVSQRYVEVTPGRVAVPNLHPQALAVYQRAVADQMDDYRALIALLEPVAAQAYFDVFRARARHPQKWQGAVHKRAQEVARYVLPVATHTYLVHTVSVLTLLRYRRLCQEADTPTESRLVVDAMCAALFAHDPLLARLDVEPLAPSALPLAADLERADPTWQRAQAAEFDAVLSGKTSVLADRFGDNQRRLADAVREVLGLPRAVLSDADAIARALDPRVNALLGESLNTTTVSKLGRTLHAAHYAFQKRISHAADSQDQRHRMTPASRPSWLAYLSAEPDYIVPRLVQYAGAAVQARYRASMERTWQAIEALRRLDVPAEWRAYLLPNAVALRFTETADLSALRHKHMMRLCYNAQEEIWQASLDEAAAISAVEPLIGAHLLAPCGVRAAAGLRPYCPEGDRYCGVPVWTQPRSTWSRTL